jgi:t-SNARE complex subunit (syntaxin)
LPPAKKEANENVDNSNKDVDNSNKDVDNSNKDVDNSNKAIGKVRHMNERRRPVERIY